MSIGRKQWAIAEGYIPPYSQGPSPQMTSHEAMCILNAGDETAHVEVLLTRPEIPLVPIGSRSSRGVAATFASITSRIRNQSRPTRRFRA